MGRLLKRLRRAKGWSQAALADAAGITRPYVTSLESGARTNPSVQVLKRLARALGVPPATLL